MSANQNISCQQRQLGLARHCAAFEWMDGWLGFNGILSTQVAAISCLKKFRVY